MQDNNLYSDDGKLKKEVINMKRKILKGIALTITLAATFMLGKNFNTKEKIK